MFESLLTLEKDRSEVVRQITQCGDFRSGSIVGVMGRCGKPNCHCAQAGDPGHGHHLRLTAKIVSRRSMSRRRRVGCREHGILSRGALARRGGWDLARRLHPNHEAQQQRWRMIRQSRLEEGKIGRLGSSLRSIQSPHPELAATIGAAAGYFEKNAVRMRYPKFRRQHLFVGTGVMEADCKTVIGSRLKQSGMFGTVRGANAIIALRCCCRSGRFEEYWEARCA